MNRPCCRKLIFARLGQLNENDTIPTIAAFNQLALLHARELVREPAFIPTHRSGQILLTHLPFAEIPQTGQNPEIGTGKPGSFCQVFRDATHNFIAHDFERVPYPKFLWGKRFAGHEQS